MILKKPYAFFIKLFKPIHLSIALLVAYLIYKTNKILGFLNNYIHSDISVVGNDIQSKLINGFVFAIPIIIMILSLILLGIMYRKHKPFRFYVIVFLLFLVDLIIILYTSNFLASMEQAILSIKAVKLVHDFVLIAIMIETIQFVLFMIRGIGIDFKKFNFDSEISKFNIEAKDNEEFELDINIDLDEYKRRRKTKFRFLKYKYVENKFLINCIFAVVVILLGVSIYLLTTVYKKSNKEGILYPLSNFNMVVNNAYILNTDFKGNTLTDNYLIVVSVGVNSNYQDVQLFSKDFNLKIGDTVFKATDRYSNKLLDLGNVYNEEVLTNSLTNYIFVYEISEKYTTSEMVFNYNDRGSNLNVKFNPKSIDNKEETKTFNLGDTISFNDVLGDINFKINSFDVRSFYKLNYNYCIEKDYCINSYEYLYPTLNTNYDKAIMKLDVEFNDNSDLNLKSFYEFLTRFGSIYYDFGSDNYLKLNEFEEIKSKRINTKEKYIGVDFGIISARNVKLVFNIRGYNYEYILR